VNGTVSIEPASARLPVPPRPLIGRERELDEARRLLLEEGARPVTFTGPGGVALAEGDAERAPGRGPETLERAWAAGRGLSLEAAELALTSPAPSLRPRTREAAPAPAPVVSPTMPLSAREQQVAALIAQGHTRKEIDDRLATGWAEHRA
jgi:hypothetical protein